MGVKTAIPVTVFTGFLGAGKTTIILSLLPKLPKDYKVVLLKNEFGDVEVDSQLASNSSLTAVSEILNGCMCCVLVGQMKTALLEIRDQHRPDRIIIESSGSAFPATLAFQIRELEKETNGDFKLDAIVTVVDAENFRGYEDTSPTAKMQAQYTDVILLNKWEHGRSELGIVQSLWPSQYGPALDSLLYMSLLPPVPVPQRVDSGISAVGKVLNFVLEGSWFQSHLLKRPRPIPPDTLGISGVSERDLDIVLDHLGTLNDLTPKLKCEGKSGVPPSLIFGLDSKQFLHPAETDKDHHSEVETLTLSRGISPPHTHSHPHSPTRAHVHAEPHGADLPLLTRELLTGALGSLPTDSVYRVKGFLSLVPGEILVLNWAFGRFELVPLSGSPSSPVVKSMKAGDALLTVMGAVGEVKRYGRKLGQTLGARLD